MGKGAFVKLTPLTGMAAGEAEASFDALASALRGAPLGCTARITLLSGSNDEHSQQGTISVREGDAQRAAEADPADIEVITSP